MMGYWCRGMVWLYSCMMGHWGRMMGCGCREMRDRGSRRGNSGRMMGDWGRMMGYRGKMVGSGRRIMGYRSRMGEG